MSNPLTLNTMKKIYIIVVLLLTGMMAEAQTSVWEGKRRLWTRGEGTEDSPFLIETADNLAFLSYIVNKGVDTRGVYFELTTDIDLNGSEVNPWLPIGMGNRWFADDGCDRTIDPSFQDNYFSGHFDGGGHSIYNLYVDSLDYAGLFGRICCWYNEGATIENINIESGYVNGKYSGGIVGDCAGIVVISNCLNNAEIVGTEVAGGIVGKGCRAIRNCSNSGHITGGDIAGGIVGAQPNEITECFNTGDIVVNGNTAGGILGKKSGGQLIIVNCYNRGDLSGSAENGIGGLAGIAFSHSSDIRNCYNVGSITNDGGNAGGLFGYDQVGSFENAYYLNTCGGWGPGWNRTAEEMRDPAFVGALNLDTNVWGFDEDNINDGYPILTGTLMTVDETAACLMSVYPNPAKGNFIVEGTGWLSISNLLGQTVYENAVEVRTEIALPEGIYLLRLNDGKATATTKVVVY